MKVTFLGTGANGGTPQIDCRCGNCKLALKNKGSTRLRSSLLVETRKSKIILDCGPDFRQQLIRANLSLQDISLIVITHFHPDHSCGLAELGVGQKLNIPVLLPKKVKLAEIINSVMPSIKFLQGSGFITIIEEVQAKRFGIELTSVPHSEVFQTSGILVKEGGKSIFYAPDVSKITLGMKKVMKKANLIVFDSTFLNEENAPAASLGHITIEKAIPDLVKTGRRVVFSHINHTENPQEIEKVTKDFGFSVAEEMQSINI